MARQEIDKEETVETQKNLSVEQTKAQFETKKITIQRKKLKNQLLRLIEFWIQFSLEQKIKKKHLVEVKSFSNPLLSVFEFVAFYFKFQIKQGGEIQMIKDETGMKKGEYFFSNTYPYVLSIFQFQNQKMKTFTSAYYNYSVGLNKIKENQQYLGIYT
ncbi:unnamed protein product [Paramecium sonneborni]|uniref:Uncharacterized protein n=1 Tax=Paramecium sonneborni TaxID=65129 RepID=A0A8S1MAH9_9CILI|nr:unnamed protein product [Paramecium sonneborni]